eukprot:jgi/Psemu1/10558/gm1.10558_g
MPSLPALNFSPALNLPGEDDGVLAPGPQKLPRQEVWYLNPSTDAGKQELVVY